MTVRPDLLLIRHAPIARAGILCGRTDAEARIDPAHIAALRSILPDLARVVASPAIRCAATAQALFPGTAVTKDPRLWEQDFGIHDGQPATEMPDLGPIPPEDLIRHRWEGGESFDDLCARIAPALADLASRARTEGPIAVVAHAGTVRAALATVVGAAPALSFEVAPLSLTRLTFWPGATGIACVNRIAA
ncbi:histidine phosphatase family protein [Palleronia abyssalis]|uniref:Uncharacterized protein n=1 Tax=Palleronia abyssalis TaxID=1501240 RepID=A0A2R8BTK5_9RHOB|nr:histidine phosphatase family protein [Palleronia abyssalis]SPJ23416.1 hypothetical protein PAA8504_01227 [Palleronia abyssalis]